MKKLMVCLILCILVIGLASCGKKNSETGASNSPVTVNTKAPEITTAPEMSQSPEITVAPEMSPSPEITATPEISVTPEQTATPEISPSPQLDEGEAIYESGDPVKIGLYNWHTERGTCVDKKMPYKSIEFNESEFKNVPVLEKSFDTPEKITEKVNEPIVVKLNEDNAQVLFFKEGILQINDKIYDFSQLDECPDNTCFYLIDVDKNDKYIEIVFYGDGPSGDPNSYFFRYINNELVTIGTISATLSSLHFDGEGTIVCHCERGDIIQTNWVKTEYVLNEDEIMFCPQEYFCFTEQDWDVTLSEELKLYKEPNENSETFIMKPQNVTFIQSDMYNWVQIKGNEDKVIGWFQYLDGDMQERSMEIFEGLNMAD